MNYNQVIVVEGLHDEAKLKSIFKGIDIITTNGIEISRETLNLIKKTSEKKDIVLFLDPDGPGEKIRNKIIEIVPNAKHAFINRKKCISKNNKKVGVEHASKEDIIESLSNLLEISDSKSDITMAFLYDLKLIGFNNSSLLREKVSEYFNIGKPNGKTFFKRLQMFGILQEEILIFLKNI